MPHRKYTAEQVKNALEQSGGMVSPAAKMLGCARKTVDRYIAEYQSVAEAKFDAAEAMTDIAEDALCEAVRRGEPWAVCFYLKCKAKDRGYVEKLRLDGYHRHAGADGAPLTIRVVYEKASPKPGFAPGNLEEHTNGHHAS